MVTFEELKKLFVITNMLTVRVPKGVAAQTVSLRVSGANVRATYLTNLEAGEAIALLTDKGNWYLTGAANETENTSSRRIIEYRRSVPIKKVTDLGIAIIIDVYYPIGVDPNSNPFLYPIESNNKYYICEIKNSVYTIKKEVPDLIFLNPQVLILGFKTTRLNTFDIGRNTREQFDESVLNGAYYSLGYGSDKTLKLLTASAREEILEGVIYDYASGYCQVDSIGCKDRVNQITNISIQMPLSTTTNPFIIINPTITDSVQSSNQLLGFFDETISFCIKYQNSSGTIKYLAISGVKDSDGDSSANSRDKGIVIWDLGDINNLSSRVNPCCNLGLLWLFENNQVGLILSGGFWANISASINPTNPATGQKPMPSGDKPFTAYGSVGGIVLKVDIPGTYDIALDYPYRQQVFIFIKEEFLEGEENTTLTPNDAIFSSPINASVFPDVNYQPVNVGEMPPPLENKDLFVPYSKLKRVGDFKDVVNEEFTIVKRLAQPTIFNEDKKKKTFSG
ncbi:hypothetical protein [Nostoc punctiforme]|uniref:Uncharacterized protein n=2 Tax=Nostoc punctiforme TaxID=272131 RepID=B2ITA0_NOSP7|nr:hypothetical protein [Nostoc punctiforme]ACC81131.1 hypothetical protein Npun_R2577 [Nostoc punctiforme PCC 73102]RCJ29178.1 hypothetical protein A6769_35885 [Nostoc punctiforme NIES-2108]